MFGNLYFKRLLWPIKKGGNMRHYGDGTGGGGGGGG